MLCLSAELLHKFEPFFHTARGLFGAVQGCLPQLGIALAGCISPRSQLFIASESDCPFRAAAPWTLTFLHGVST